MSPNIPPFWTKNFKNFPQKTMSSDMKAQNHIKLILSSTVTNIENE